MRRHLPFQLLACAALAGTASFGAIALPGGIAGAKSLSVKCTGLTGNGSSSSITGCKGSGLSETGSSGTSVTDTTTATSGTSTITWSTGATSDEAYTYKELTGSKDKCPAPPAGFSALAEVTEKGSVTGGTALVGSKVKGTVCVYSDGSTILVNGKGSQTI
jgi:hypothetical protein